MGAGRTGKIAKAKEVNRAQAPPQKRKLIEFDPETWNALELFSRDSMKSIQEIADEAFADVLKKHHRPTGLKEALRESVRQPPGGLKKWAKVKTEPEKLD
jgi:hypothetical protein